MKRIFILFFFFNLFLNLFAQREHIIQKGETIESVAKKYGLRVDELQDANPIAIKYFYVNTPLVIPQHVPTAEEIRMQEEATERYLARQRQEAEEKAAKKARKREFWGNVFGSLAQGAIIGMNSYYSNTTSSISNGYTYNSMPTEIPSMGSMNIPKFQPDFNFSQIPTPNFTVNWNELEKERETFFENYKRNHPGCKENEVENAYSQYLDRKIEESNRQFNAFMSNMNNSNSGTSTNTTTTTTSTTPTPVPASSRNCSFCNGTGKMIVEQSVATFGLDSSRKYCDICKRYVTSGYSHGHVFCNHCHGTGKI